MSVDEKYPLALPAGTVLAGQYTIDKVLGQGGFGITYMATDYKTKGKVAVKEFFPDTLAYREVTTVISYPGERSENFEYGKTGFLQEAKTLAEFIGCENIVRIHSYFEENGTAYFVMDYIEGTSFDSYLKQRGGKISCEEAGKILIPVMEALAIVHSKGIVHRDVTPDNIYITSDGTVKLLDFGAARYSLGDKSRSLDVILKHGFAPKEQYTRRGKQGPFTDVYSLGATFYFALTGKRPPDSVERLDEDDLIPPSSLGVQLTEYQEEAILKALNVQPSDRYQSMLDFRNAYLNAEMMSQPVQRTPAMQAAQSGPVVQQFFTAPEQPVQQPAYPPTQGAIQPTQGAIPPTQGAIQPTQAVYSQGIPQQNIPSDQAAAAKKNPLAPIIEKIKKNPRVTAIAASAAVICLIAAIAIPAAVKNSKKDNDIIKNSGYEDDAPASTTSNALLGQVEVPDEFKPAKTDPVVTEQTTVKTTTKATTTTQKQASTSNGDAEILGNRVGNIGNSGLFLSNNKYWIDNGRHSIKHFNSDGDAEEILTGDDGEFSCLSMIGDDLFFIFDKVAYIYSISKDEFQVIPELKNYSASFMRLYVSNDYYFIYLGEAGGISTLYRVSRVTGKEEDSIRMENEVSFTFYNKDLYYLSNSNSESIIYMVSATDFDEVKAKKRYTENSPNLQCVVAADDYVYLLCYEHEEGELKTYIDKYDLKLEERISYDDITSICKGITGSDYNIAYLNVIDDNKFICLYINESGKNNAYSPGLYHLYYDSNKKIKYDEIAPLGSGVWGSYLYRGDGYIEVDYMKDDGDDHELKYRKFDSE